MAGAMSSVGTSFAQRDATSALTLLFPLHSRIQPSLIYQNPFLVLHTSIEGL
jgi:hypothetical protein